MARKVTKRGKNRAWPTVPAKEFTVLQPVLLACQLAVFRGKMLLCDEK
jgi:hypothetical protein